MRWRSLSRYRCPLAPRRLPIVLALEIQTSCRPADCAAGGTQAHPRDEHCQSAMGSATDPWRASQAGHRHRADQRGQVYGQATRATVARLEDVPFQSCRRYRGNGSVRGTDDLVSFALLLVDYGAWSTADSMVGRYIASNRGMDRKSGHASVRLGTSPQLSDPRSGWGLWRSLYPTTSINGDSGSTDVAALAMAKRICRTADRFDPTGVP